MTAREYEHTIKMQRRMIDRLTEHLESIADYERRNPMSAPDCITGSRELLNDIERAVMAIS